jgi:hypothetical protein
MSNDIANNGDYVKDVRQLPRPTAAQTALFASYVSKAHSWYKHLPPYPKVPFYFFLDPNAGKKIVYDQTGKVRFEEETSENGFHYTHQTTKRYRKRFGYWNYHAAYGTSFRLPLKDGEVSSTESSLGLKILGLQGETLEISPALIETGTAYLSAFVHPHTNIGIMIRRYKRRLESLESDFLATLDRAPSTLPEDLRFLWAVLNTEGWYPLDDDNPMVSNEAYQNVFSKEDMFYRIDEERLYKKATELGVSLPKVLQAAEIRQTLQSRGSAIKSEEGKNLRHHLVRERIQQLESMKTAMNNFLDAVYES